MACRAIMGTDDSHPLDQAALVTAPIFQNLPDQVRDELCRLSTPLQIDKGDRVFSAGQAAESLYVLVDGQLKLFQDNLDEQENIIDVFWRAGEMLLVSPQAQSVFPISCEALGRARVLSIPTAHIRSLVSEHPDLALSIITEMARQRRNVQCLVAELKSKTVIQRLAGFLSGIVEEDADPTRPVQVSMPVSRRVLANIIGVSAEKLSVNFGALKDYGVSTQGRSVCIQNLEILEKLHQDG